MLGFPDNDQSFKADATASAESNRTAFLCLCIQRSVSVFTASPLTQFLIIQRLPYVNYSVEPALPNRRSNLRDEAATGVLR